jgi:phage tail-like protein
MTDWLPGKKDQIAGYTFQLEVDGITEATFRECGGLDNETQVIESKEAGLKGQTVIRKLPGALKWGDINLKRGFTKAGMELHDWRQKAIDGDLTGMRKNGSIVVYDYKNEEVLRLNFTNGWISKLGGPTLNASGNDVAVETITIVHEGLKRIK